MENASKALIIAGTIIIVMLLIVSGVYLFDRAGGLSGGIKNKWSQDQINAFNNQFMKYEGQQSGSRVKELISAVNKSNESSDTKVHISGPVYGSDHNFYPKAQLINSRIYNIKLDYGTGDESAIIKTITISE